MVKKTKLFGLPKFWSLRSSTSASLKIGEILAIRKKIGKFLKLGIALILRYLLTDLLLKKLALVQQVLTSVLTKNILPFLTAAQRKPVQIHAMKTCRQASVTNRLLTFLGLGVAGFKVVTKGKTFLDVFAL